jgi:hypothetical protein
MARHPPSNWGQMLPAMLKCCHGRRASWAQGVRPLMACGLGLLRVLSGAGRGAKGLLGAARLSA